MENFEASIVPKLTIGSDKPGGYPVTGLTTYGVDLAKSTMHIFGMTGDKVIYDANLPREKALLYFSKQQPSVVVMEACGGSNWWAQKLSSMGHSVKLISPQFVKPFASRQKNDRNDARAVLEASLRPQVRTLRGKTQEQQDLQALIKVRQSTIAERVSVGNQIEALLLEYGVVLKRQQNLLEVLEDDSNDLTEIAREILKERYDHKKSLREKEKYFSERIESVLEKSSVAKKLMAMKGVGPVITASFISTISHPEDFKCGRNVSAYLGLVPRQVSSGKTVKLLGITKTGNSHLRQALVHGARSWVLSCKLRSKSTDQDADTKWINELVARKPYNVASVAIANKMARRMWAVMRYA